MRNREVLLHICVPTFNRSSFVIKQYERLIEEIQTSKLEDQVFVTISDNGSSDNTWKLLSELSLPGYVNLKKSPANVGFANHVINLFKQSTGEYTYILSDDDYLEHGALKKMVSKIKKYHPDLLYINCRPAAISMTETTDGSKLCVTPQTSLLLPGLQYSAVFLNSGSFLNELYKLGLFNVRILLAQVSCCVYRTSVMKKNEEEFSLNTKFSLERNAYPHTYLVWSHLPAGAVVLAKDICLFVATNNRTWNSDTLTANAVIQQYFDPIVRWIKQRYSSSLGWKSRLILSTSLMYSRIVPLIYRAMNLVNAGKIIERVQFGRAGENKNKKTTIDDFFGKTR